MGIMIIPLVSSLSDDVISSVPQSMREGSYGLGATKSETIKKVILPAALPGIIGGILLAASRAIGETMIVVMAITTIIVSPIAREAAKRIPPIMPGKAAGRITFLIVSDFVAPNPYEPSLIDCGTLEITSSDREETRGIIIIPITKPTPRALSELRKCSGSWFSYGNYDYSSRFFSIRWCNF